ncbi:MAG: ABC transporter permease, partial [Candidatus Rokubacteria bacterium]|nr:ABC transporter permease [Candidatus Rokubacteria bacterium]
YYVGHGAEGVGRATTEAVVLASVLILVLDYFMGSVMP